jgi:pyruvate dehydrogenase E1 component beta subunit
LTATLSVPGVEAGGGQSNSKPNGKAEGEVQKAPAPDMQAEGC